MRRVQGFALASALVAIVLVAVLVTGALFASAQESQSSSAQITDQKLLPLAERAALMTASAWPCSGCDLLPVGSVNIQNQAAPPPLASSALVTRLDSAVYLITGEARLMAGESIRAQRRVSIAVKITRDSLGNSFALPITGDWWVALYQM